MLTNKTTLKWGAIALMLLGLSSCRTPKDITYFQDIQNGTRIETAPVKEMTVQPDDRLAIMVHSKDPQLASLFNLQTSQQRAVGSQIVNNGNGANQMPTYTVDTYGDIEFPVLGTLHIGGMTRPQVAEYIKKEIMQRNLVKDPTVIVDFYNRTVNVLGEVKAPGKIDINRDRFTVLDAIAEAGDLTIDGRRTNVIVLRQEDGRQVAHTIDLTNAQATAASPVYYLQQNDVIYVEPNDVRKRQTTSNGSTVFTPAFWISILSFATTVVLLVKNW